jgi:hypothetical protein
MTTTQNTQTTMDTTSDVQISAQSVVTKGEHREQYLKVGANRTRLISDPSHLLVDVGAFEAAIGNKPLFTREVLEQVAADLAEAKALDPVADSISVPHVLGDGEWASKHHGPDIMLGFTRSYELVTRMGNAPLYETAPAYIGKDSLVKNVIKPDDIDTHLLRKAIAGWAHFAPHSFKMAAMQQRIEVSRAIEEIKKLIVASPVRIDDVVCLALGNPYWNTSLKENTCGQHLLAWAIAGAVAEHKESTASIPIVAFDPDYDIAACHLLAHLRHPIHIVSSPYKYLSMTPNTLVICIGIPVFTLAYEIMADSLFPSGPAALICIEFPEQPWHVPGLTSLCDPLVPRVAKMLEQYEVGWVGDFVPKVQDSGLKELQWLRNVVWYGRKG